LSLPRTKGVPNPVHQLVGQEAVICCISGWHALKGDPLPPNWSLATLRSRPGGRASLGQGGRIPLCSPPIYGLALAMSAACLALCSRWPCRTHPFIPPRVSCRGGVV